MRILRGVITLVVTMALGWPAFAAILTAGQGTVLVNRGNGYEKVQGVTEVKPGDVIAIDPSASAQLTYPDGCSVPVQVGSLVTVAEQSPCLTTQATSTPQTAPGFGSSSVYLLGLGVAGGVVGIVLSNQSDKAASP